ncbi:MAG: hypothetical protein C0404_10520 [Verrucomicrobia bacterium]|nr:hypothetical protein [Verrucomicrobiota bacterium]
MFFGFQSYLLPNEGERQKGRAIEFWVGLANRNAPKDVPEASRCLEEAGAVALTLTTVRDTARAVYWLALAWVDLCGDIKAGASLINHHSISRSRRVDFWVHAQKQLRGRHEGRVRRELLKIARGTDELMDLLNIVDNWRDCFGKEYEDDLISLMNDMTELSEDGVDLVSCARQWQLLFDHQYDDLITDCLTTSEAQPETPDPACCMEQAALWVHLGNEAKARNRMLIAEAETTAIDLPVLALSWHEIFNDDIAATRILEKAYGHARATKNVEDLWFCACSWLALSTEDAAQKAGNCLEMAATFAATSHDWYCIGSGWHTLGRRDAAKQYAARAELLAKTAEDWCDCARLWQGLGDFPDEEDRCRKEYHRLSDTEA